MHFKSIRLKNFQGYKDSSFNLDKGYTCIVGENNKGKSSIVRALMFVYFDLWEKSFVRKGAEFVEVTIERDDGVSITRKKGDSVNEIIVEKNGKVIDTFNNFGKTLPDEIKNKFQIQAVKLDISKEENLNIANQFDQPFLLFESGPTKLKILNRITGAHIVDIAQRELAKDKKRLFAKSRELEEFVVEGENKLQQYKNLDNLEKRLDKATRAFNKVEKLIKEEDKLISIKLELKDWKKRLQEFKELKQKLERVDLQAVTRIRQLHEKFRNLQKLASNYDKIIDSLAKNSEKLNGLKESYVKVLKKARKLLIEEKICPTCFRKLEEKEVKKIVEKRYKI